MEKNGLLYRLQRRLLLADKNAAFLKPPQNWPNSVASAVKTRESGQDPATRTFQAFRIFINRELEELQQALEASLEVLEPGGKLVVISFHSLEDRIVKQFIAKHSKEQFDRRAPFARPQEMALKSLARIKPSEQEVLKNPRSRSAIMRVAQRLGSSSGVHA
jgi:16S rRNA (cytosine1402-N4)-methyltransferase